MSAIRLRLFQLLLLFLVGNGLVQFVRHFPIPADPVSDPFCAFCFEGARPFLSETAVLGNAVTVRLGIVLSLMVALALVWRSEVGREVRATALFWVLTMTWFVPGLLAFALPHPLLSTLGGVLTIGNAAAFLRFAAIFPRALTAEDVKKASASRSAARLLRTVRRVYAAPAAAPLRRAARRWGATIPARMRSLPPPRTWALRPGVVWGCAAFGSVACVGYLAWTGRAPGMEWQPLLFVFALAHGTWYLRANYRLSGIRERRRILWIVQPLYYLVLGLLSVLLLVPLSAFVTRATGLGEGIGVFFVVVPLTLMIMCVAVPVCVAFAIFFDGAVDPGLAIRKGTVYSIVGAVLVLLFVVLEELASNQLASRIALPGDAGALLAGSLAALTCGPLKGWIERRTDRFLTRLLPSTLLAEQPRTEVTVVHGDLVGYSRAVMLDEARALTLISLFHTTARAVAHAHRGRLVKTMGGAVLLEFRTPQAALAAATELLDGFRPSGTTSEPGCAEIRAGMHTGPVVRGRDGDLYGAVVDLASGLAAAADPGEVVVSQAVAAQIAGREGALRRSLVPADRGDSPASLDCFRFLVCRSGTIGHDPGGGDAAGGERPVARYGA